MVLAEEERSTIDMYYRDQLAPETHVMALPGFIVVFSLLLYYIRPFYKRLYFFYYQKVYTIVEKSR